MRDTFSEAGLVVPPVPAQFREGLSEIGEWHWATHPVEPMDMYMLRAYVGDLVADTERNQAAVTHAGHGVNSYSLNFAVALDGMVMVVQTLWGGVYTDEAQAATRWADLMVACERLLEAYDAANARGATLPGRLLVVDSDFRLVRLCWWLNAETSGELHDLETTGASTSAPLTDARATLDALRG